MPTPFERLLNEVAQEASKDPVNAFGRLEELYGKSLSENDVVQLAALSVNLGGASLGRWNETAEFQRRLLTHTAVNANGGIYRSLWRGLAVVLHCAGDKSEAEKAVAIGVTNNSERCRLAIMTAQTLCSRGRTAEALPFLAQAGELCKDLKQDDEVITQTAQISSRIARLAETQILQSTDVLLAASRTAAASWSRHPDWHAHHKSNYNLGRTYLLAANPALALTVVQKMMAIEDLNDAGPVERFYTANLACRAQVIRGQFKVAAGALEACHDFSSRVAEPQAKVVRASLEELERYYASIQQST
jgi:hypothetical protein